MNAVGCPVEHRPHPQPALHHPPGRLHPLLLLVAERHVFSRERVIVAMHHELAVKARQFSHRPAVDRQALFRFLQQAPVAGAGTQGAN